MIKTIEEAVKYLESFIPKPENKHPGELGLRRMQYLVKLLGNPQLSYPIIHVGGTSGKGSTATIIASILGTKYKVGLHTSPHLVRVMERIKIFINVKTQMSKLKTTSQKLKLSKEITNRELVDLVNEIRPAIMDMEKSKIGVPSYFEILTAMAFLYFVKEKVDLAVIEVGMGGRYDATNVVKPAVAVLTNVGLDHTEVLGKTVEEIARDKAGIIKPDISVVSGVRQSAVIQTVKLKIKNENAKLCLLRKDFKYQINKITDRGSNFDYWGKKNYKNLFIPLLGKHQVENAVLAIRAVEELSNHPITQSSNNPISQSSNLPVTGKDIREGLKQVFIPGRMEVVRKKPLVLLDGAHNPDKIQALVEAVKTIWPGKKATLVLAIKEGKDANEIIKLIMQISNKVFLTSYEIMADQGKIKSYNPSELKRIFCKAGFKSRLEVIPEVKKALELAVEIADKDEIILITGSIYLIGQIKEVFS